MTTTDNKELDKLFDKYTEALTSTSERLGEVDDEIEIVSFDRRLIKDIHKLKQEILKSFTPNHEVERLVEDGKKEQMELLRWKYKELNDQTIDMKFLEAYNILMDELRLAPKDRGGK